MGWHDVVFYSGRKTKCACFYSCDDTVSQVRTIIELDDPCVFLTNSRYFRTAPPLIDKTQLSAFVGSTELNYSLLILWDTRISTSHPAFTTILRQYSAIIGTTRAHLPGNPFSRATLNSNCHAAPSNNPFNITKAVDLTNAQIRETWVNLPGDSSPHVANPRSGMPMLLLGGKGSDVRTYFGNFSYPVQLCERAAFSMKGIAMMATSGYICRCGRSHASRFRGLLFKRPAWASLFALLLDLWLHIALDISRTWLCVSPTHSEALLSRCYCTIRYRPRTRHTLRSPLSATYSGCCRHKSMRRSTTSMRRCDATTSDSFQARRLVFGVPTQFARHVPDSLNNEVIC